MEVVESYENLRTANPFSRDSQQNAEMKNHYPRGNYNHRQNQHQVRSMQVSQAYQGRQKFLHGDSIMQITKEAISQRVGKEDKLSVHTPQIKHEPGAP
jgi:hypothetical protein